MPLHPHLLSWRRPLLPQAVDWLETFAAPAARPAFDLRGVLVLVQTRQAGRRLREALSRRAAERGGALLPPRVELPDFLFSWSPASAPEPSPADQLLAWWEVLRQTARTAPADAPALFGNSPPEPGTEALLPWIRRLLEVQSLLGEAALHPRDVLASGRLPPAEIPRWESLDRLFQSWAGHLGGLGLADPLAARRAAIAAPLWPEDVHTVVLLAVTDPAPALLPLLDHLAAGPRPLHRVAWGPEDPAAFDRWGRPEPAWWQGRSLPSSALAGRLEVARDPAGEARLVASRLGPALPPPGTVAIGCQRGELAGPLSRRIPLFDPSGEPLEMTAPAHLIGLWGQVLRTPTVASLLSLVRHSWVFPALQTATGHAVAGLLASFDELTQRHLPDALASLRAFAPGYPAAAAALAFLDGRLERLRREPLDQALPDLLAELWRSLPPATQVADLRAAEALSRALHAFLRLRPAETGADPGEQLLLFSETLRGQHLYPPRPTPAIDLLGWLELPWEDAPWLLLTECASGWLPATLHGHPWLPDTLRRALGLRSNALREARDTWLLQALWHSRQEGGRLDFSYARANAAGDPLRPSRLLLQTTPEELPSRVRLCFAEPPPPPPDPPWSFPWKLQPAPLRLPPLPHLSVTAFRDYLACPFRFYLRHILRMEPLRADKLELDARDFGSLAHRALEVLREEPMLAATTDAGLLTGALQARLREEVRRRYGSDLPLPVFIQGRSLEQRLAAFARTQVEIARDGWRPLHLEWAPAADPLPTLAGLPVRGRIDRIDRQGEAGPLRLLDIKSHDKPVPPRKAHLRAATDADLAELPAYALVEIEGKPHAWRDLQLPLYAWLLRQTGETAPLVPGYLHLPKAVTETGLSLWDPEEFAALLPSAQACAEGVARDIQAGRFWPPRARVDYDAYEDLFFGRPQEAAAGHPAPPAAPPRP